MPWPPARLIHRLMFLLASTSITTLPVQHLPRSIAVLLEPRLLVPQPVVSLLSPKSFTWPAAGIGGLCGPAVAAAEGRYGTPPGLLGAIATSESGRTTPHGRQPWPWTINADGRGRYFATRQEAVAWVVQAQASGAASIDVGCLQVNLRYHPDAFATLDEAFDPAANADYAARFLVQLHAANPDGPSDVPWMRAVGFYHSMRPDLADEYRRRVRAALNPDTSERQARSPAPSLAGPRSAPAMATPAAAAVPAPAAGLMAPADLRIQARKERNPLSFNRAILIAASLESLAKAEDARVSNAARRRNMTDARTLPANATHGGPTPGGLGQGSRPLTVPILARPAPAMAARRWEGRRQGLLRTSMAR